MPTKTPKISVIMPAYNSEKYIAEAIESILDQTFTEFEFIIINDGSTDNTAKIIKEYAKTDNRIKFIDNKKNAGIVAVLNQGLNLATGEYIARMDSDDVALPKRFEKQIEYMDTHHGCGVVGTAIQVFGAKSYVWQNVSSVKLLDLLIHGAQIAHPTAMIRTSVVRDNKIYYNSRYEYAEDYAFWADIVKHAELHNLQEVLLKYRWHAGNVSVTHRKTQMNCAERVRKSILSDLLSYDKDIEKLLDMTREANERFYLFGFLPIIRRKQYSLIKTKYYLFEKIPLIREQNGKIYLFECIKIGVLK